MIVILNNNSNLVRNVRQGQLNSISIIKGQGSTTEVDDDMTMTSATVSSCFIQSSDDDEDTEVNDGQYVSCVNCVSCVDEEKANAQDKNRRSLVPVSSCTDTVALEADTLHEAEDVDKQNRSASENVEATCERKDDAAQALQQSGVEEISCGNNCCDAQPRRDFEGEEAPRESRDKAQRTSDSRIQSRSILKPSTFKDINIRNVGWKNLPKVDLVKLQRLHSQSLSSKPSAAVADATTKRTRSVEFSTINIRCYDQTVGDNPSVSYGTPISLDWKYEEIIPIGVEDYENERGPRRAPRQMMLNYYHRRNVLQYAYGFTETQLDAAQKQISSFKAQRAVTKILLPVSKVEDALTSAVRKTKRALNFKAKN